MPHANYSLPTHRGADATQAVDVRRVVRTVAATFAAVANTKGLDYRVTVTDDVPRWLLCDETRLQQIIGNLVGACRES